MSTGTALQACVAKFIERVWLYVRVHLIFENPKGKNHTGFSQVIVLATRKVLLAFTRKFLVG
jgi:hypothetical protein